MNHRISPSLFTIVESPIIFGDFHFRSFRRKRISCLELGWVRKIIHISIIMIINSLLRNYMNDNHGWAVNNRPIRSISKFHAIQQAFVQFINF
ncbi:hypothetical protein C443_05679 [Haloarcula argentinensis DSM 12282]|nr:hypothetical protein C443_05679 [Haloarcula argentinensis DSM 12282]